MKHTLLVKDKLCGFQKKKIKKIYFLNITALLRSWSYRSMKKYIRNKEEQHSLLKMPTSDD